MENNSMNFERVIEKLLFNQPNQTVNYYASIYNHYLIGTRALLYSTCVKERDYNGDSYSVEEKEELNTFIENLLLELESNNLTMITNCINLLISKC